MLNSEPYQLIKGECIEVMRDMPADTFDAVIADSPYSSGGQFRGDRSASPIQKYVQTGTTVYRNDFAGDNRDGRSFSYWSQLWLHQAYRITKPSGYILSFTDWRQLPTMTDAIQAAGWVWRGVIAWDKTAGARAAHTGYFRHQCEYIVWGTKGVSRPADHGGPFPGCYRFPVKQVDKFHLTGKPTPLMQELVKIVPPDGLILDPFSGSATTGVGALLQGRRFVGIEIDDHWYQVGRNRLEMTLNSLKGAA